MPVKPKYIKESGEEIFNSYPEEVSEEFDKNKTIVNHVMDGISRPVRNKVAGYVTRLVVREKNNED